jgi:hypothetical protein
MNLREVIARIVKEALVDNGGSDPLVDDTSGAIAYAITSELESPTSVVANNAFEMMMGSSPDENRLTKVRLEDISAMSELVVQAVYRDAGLHDVIKQIATNMIQSAMDTVEPRSE